MKDILLVVSDRVKALENGVFQVDDNAPQPGNLGLFPKGRKLLWEKTDVLGNKKRRAQYSFLLRRQAVPSQENAQKWLFLQEALAEGPSLGEDTRWQGRQGQFTGKAGGLGQYEMTLTVEFTEIVEGV